MALSITYEAQGRTGNNLIQYATCKLIEIMFGRHKFVCKKWMRDPFILDDNAYKQFIEGRNEEIVKNKNVLCKGFFQDDRLLLRFRERLLEEILNSKEIIYDNNCRNRSLRSFFQTIPTIYPTDRDIVISLRLEDFFHPSAQTTDIVPPKFYLDILSRQTFERLIIVCKQPSSDRKWEERYLTQFAAWNPILIHGSLEEDSALMRAAPRLIHSNSTLCWFNSYLSNKIQRFIPDTGFYPEQRLGIIDPTTDCIIKIKPMTHQEVLAL